MTDRKIIQILLATKASMTGGPTTSAVIALCSDGTVWNIDYHDGISGKWEQIPSIPQNKPVDGSLID